MVAVFARLKLSLIARGHYSQQRRMILLAGMAVLILVGGGLGFIGFAMTRVFELQVAADSARAAVTSLFLAWIISPFLLAGYDETIRPPHLALLPLRRRSLLAGMAAAAWIGAPPLSSAIVLLGTVPALGRSALGVAAGLIGWLLAAALCLYTSRVVATAVSSLMGTRLARDLAIVAVMALLGASVLLSSLLTEAIAMNTRLLTTIGAVLRWFPPGAAISAGADASTGDYGRLAFDIFIPLAMLIVVLAGWERALQRSMLRSSLSTTVRAERAQRHPRWSPRSRAQAAAWRMWRYLWRSSRYRAAGFHLGLSQVSSSDYPLRSVPEP